MKGFIAECRRRRVFRTAGLYIVGAWVVLQVAALAFENWGLPGAAMRYVWSGAVAGFPVALLLGWCFDVSAGHIRRTGDNEQDIDRTLRRSDYVVLAVIAIAALALTAGLTVGILQTRSTAPESDRTANVDPKSIAVLPFVDLSPAGDQVYFSYGIAEELLNLLAKFSDLQVTSRTSSFKASEAGLSVPEIASELKVANVLEGSVRKAGERIRVTAQLIDARSDTHLWSETYDGDLDDVFAIQDSISAQVAQELKATLRSALPAGQLTDAASYDLYLQGRRLLARRGDDGLSQAVDLFERVTAQDPSFAQGHASLAQAIFWSGGPGADTYARIESSAKRALALEPANSEALAVLGRVRVDQGDVATGRDLLERSIASNPNNPLGYRWLGQTYVSADPARYVALAQQAYLRDPLDPTIHWHEANALRLMGRTDEALAAARSRLKYDPEDPLAFTLAAACHLSAGELDRALKSYYRAYRAYPDSSDYETVLDILGWIGELDLAEAWVREIERRFGNVGRAEAIVDHLRGNTGQALQRIRDAIEHGFANEFQLAFLTLRFTHDLVRTRAIYDKAFAGVGKDPTQFDPDETYWVIYVDYALLLQRAGETAAAARLIGDIGDYYDRQIAEGVMISGNMDHLQYLYAQLLAIGGKNDSAVVQLTQAVRNGSSCIQCLDFPHFDSIRDEPGFVAARQELEARVAAQRQRLADERMLLTPGEVMALDEVDFDPFVR